ncbi:extensin family protein [Paracoccus sp. S1E-3]|uniref:extensin-like domain-containing protein n=1 Tax=Paracoccus sp. S1E-3 TaxID=2756130 RepID=UPI0015EE5AB5|nr:extensin family protein [Paracoccus sp. S1E-3]MBA4492236.1 extensin family protein [Paracoccus sp. S1E-3]
MTGWLLATILGVAMMSAPSQAQEPPHRPPGSTAPEAADRGQNGALTDSVRPPARPEAVSKPDATDAAADQPSATDAVPPQPNAANPAPPSSGGTDAAPAPPPTAPATDPVPAGPPAWQALAEGALPYRFCLMNLNMLGVGYREVAPMTSPEDADCGIARPIQVDSLQPGVTIAGGALMRCDTARRLALWLRAEAQPAAALLPGAPRIAEILPGSTYQCRARVGGASDKLSEHALGNAFDVAGLRFSNGEEMLIEPRDDSGGIEEAFQKAIRYGACLYFTTVLGPGSNAAHDDHLHFDGAVRKGGWRLCE